MIHQYFLMNGFFCGGGAVAVTAAAAASGGVLAVGVGAVVVGAAVGLGVYFGTRSDACAGATLGCVTP